jgi:hypothetical protein
LSNLHDVIRVDLAWMRSLHEVIVLVYKLRWGDEDYMMGVR